MKDQKFPLRPASREEAGLFYSNDERDEVLGTVGHLRMDFGSGGKGFHHTWWPHNEDRFNTPEFKEALQEFVDAMRQSGPLKNLAAMNTYCWHNGGEISENDRVYGFVAETERYRFCLRCTPRPGDYQGYLYCYDLRQQEMARQEKLVGRVTYASGEQQEFCDPQRYLQTIREELPYVEPGDEFKEVYRRGEIAPYFDHSGAPVVLEVSKGYFDDPGYDNDKTAILNLPATDAAIWRAVEAVDAASEEECAFRCTDCLLPSLRDAINDAIDEEGGIGQINEFAQLLAQKNQIWDANDLVKYKALLSVAGHPSLQDAMQLMHGLDAYELRPEVAQTWEYAEAALREKYPDLPEVLFQTPQAGQVGRELLERDHAVITDYGLLRRKDGSQLPVFQPEQQENEITGPAFAGM